MSTLPVIILRRAQALVANIVKVFEQNKKVGLLAQNLLPGLVGLCPEKSVFTQRHNQKLTKLLLF
jgi:hypothetical protein